MRWIRFPAAALLVACHEAPQPASTEQAQSFWMTKARAWHSMTVLPSGKVLVAGGFIKNSGETHAASETAELFDPADGTFAPTGSMTTPRYGHAAVLLPTGKVLVAGGETMDFEVRSALASAELYDPATGTFAPTADMATRRAGPAVLLPSGKVLAIGGLNLPQVDGGGNTASGAAELFDPDTETWAPTGALALPHYFSFTATLLASGDVLVVGGAGTAMHIGATDTAEIYRSASGAFELTASLDYPVAGASAALLPDGDVLLAGGCIGGDGFCSSDDVLARIYRTADGSWSRAAPLRWGRETAAALRLPSGKIMLVGGTQYSDGDTCVEVYDPASASWSWRDALGHDHGNGAAAVLLPGGDALIAGGTLTIRNQREQDLIDRATISAADRFTPEAP